MVFYHGPQKEIYFVSQLRTHIVLWFKISVGPQNSYVEILTPKEDRVGTFRRYLSLEGGTLVNGISALRDPRELSWSLCHMKIM